jgi:hypothetical protein
MACDARKLAVCALRQPVEPCWIALRADRPAAFHGRGVTTSPLLPTPVTTDGRENSPLRHARNAGAAARLANNDMREWGPVVTVPDTFLAERVECESVARAYAAHASASAPLLRQPLAPSGVCCRARLPTQPHRRRLETS